MGKLSRVEISDGKCVFTSIPGETTPELVSNKQAHAAGKRIFIILGIAACALLAVAGVTVLRRRRRARSWH